MDHLVGYVSHAERPMINKERKTLAPLMVNTETVQGGRDGLRVM